MRYSFDEATARNLRSGLMMAVYALSITPIVTVTLFLPHGSPVRVPFLLAGLAVLAVVLIYVGGRLVTAGHTTLNLSPLTVTCMVLAAIVMIGMLQMSDGGPHAVYLDVFIVVAVFTGIVGNVTMRVSTLVAIVPAVAWTTWGVGIRGWTLLTVVIMVPLVCAAAASMTAHSIADLSGIGQSRALVDKLTVSGTGAETIEDGLSACLPLVAGILPATRVVAFMDREGSGNYVPVAAWPEPSDDADLAMLEGFVGAINSRRSVVQPEHCFIPVGKTTAGNLAVVVVRQPDRLRSLAYVTEITNALAGSLLRMCGRVAFVEELRRESMIDPLTGLPNRRILWEQLGVEIERSARTRSPMCVAMVDLDHFKEYNDEFGHLAGDEMLRIVSATMASVCRRQDLLVRFGGEEFCFVLTDVDLTAATSLMEKVRGLSYRVGDRRALTISIGVAARIESDDSASLLGRADRALYTAKQAGRNRVIAATDPTPGTIDPSRTSSSG